MTKNKGFTLIELMIIVAGTAILLAMVMQYSVERIPPRFNNGDCVVHALDPNTEGIVLRSPSKSYIEVRFNSQAEESVYYEHELKACENDGTIVSGDY